MAISPQFAQGHDHTAEQRPVRRRRHQAARHADVDGQPWRGTVGGGQQQLRRGRRTAQARARHFGRGAPVLADGRGQGSCPARLHPAGARVRCPQARGVQVGVHVHGAQVAAENTVQRHVALAAADAVLGRRQLPAQFQAQRRGAVEQKGPLEHDRRVAHAYFAPPRVIARTHEALAFEQHAPFGRERQFERVRQAGAARVVRFRQQAAGLEFQLARHGQLGRTGHGRPVRQDGIALLRLRQRRQGQQQG